VKDVATQFIECGPFIQNAACIVMSNRQSPLLWSFPIGTWFSTEVRVSVFFPLLVLVLWARLQDAQFVAIFGVIIVLSVLAHEFGHVVAARYTGGLADGIVLWPLGGLAIVEPASTFASKFHTAAAGPFVNGMICLLTLPAVLHSELCAATLNPLTLPFHTFSESLLLEELLILTFAVNWMLFLVNLIPVYPMDGGRILQACLATRLSGDAVAMIYLRIGFVVAFLLLLAGLMLDGAWIVFIGAIVLMMNLQESMQMQSAESSDDSFMGYDFSQGYTSLEKSESSPQPRREGRFERWRAQRRIAKEQRRQQQEEQIEIELDALLDKVHRQGMDSLTEHEKRKLQKASVRYRNKDDEPD
jgi:stage IV sporulation protein FB